MTFSTTIFPRINFIKNFGDRLQQRIANGRVAMFFNRLVTGDASLDLDFASTKSLTDSVSGDNLITFTRASSATYVGSDGLIATAATNEPRFDHDPATGESLGLLIEEARTNLMLNSGTTAEMRPTGSTSRTSGGFAAPDGSTDASRVNLPEVTQPGEIKIVSEILGVSPNTDYTASIYLKGLNGGEVVYLTLASSVPTSSVTATLTTEWQRFDITGLSNSGVLYFNVGVDTRPGTGQSNQPAQSFYIWGAQIEYGSFPTSYIPTTSPPSPVRLMLLRSLVDELSFSFKPKFSGTAACFD